MKFDMFTFANICSSCRKKLQILSLYALCVMITSHYIRPLKTLQRVNPVYRFCVYVCRFSHRVAQCISDTPQGSFHYLWRNYATFWPCAWIYFKAGEHWLFWDTYLHFFFLFFCSLTFSLVLSSHFLLLTLSKRLFQCTLSCVLHVQLHCQSLFIISTGWIKSHIQLSDWKWNHKNPRDTQSSLSTEYNSSLF